jgi:2,3-bisphosphoglycerate-dependent phosphoglycerate mutase
LEIIKDERIKERCYGDLQGKSKLELQMDNPELLKEYRRSFDQAPPNGESLKQVCERVAEFCDEIVPLAREHNINIAISCHGNSIRGFRKYFEGLNDEETRKVETPLGQDYAAYTL